MMYDEGFKWWNMGSASAIAFLLFIIVFAVTVLMLRVGSRGDEA
jgi:multiple sugar transport system permease protein